MVEWPFTMLGRQFFDGTLPRLASALERIADALERLEKLEQERKGTGEDK